MANRFNTLFFKSIDGAIKRGLLDVSNNKLYPFAPKPFTNGLSYATGSASDYRHFLPGNFSFR